MQDGLSVETTAPGMRLMRIRQSDVLLAILLALVLLLGGYFRFTGLNWDDYVRFHPDERFLSGVAVKLDQGYLNFTGSESQSQQIERCLARNPNTNGLGGYFDTRCSDWNPHNIGEGLYVYGTLPLFIARIAGQVAVDLTNDRVWTGYDGIHLIWRLVSAIADMLVILLVFLTASKLHGRWTGLLAAALYAFAVFPIQVSHFGTADAISNLFVILTIYAAVRVQDHGRWWDYAGFGVAFGMALASRVNIAPLMGLVIVAAIIQMLPAFARQLAPGERERILTAHMGGLVLVGMITFLAFRIFNPYAFQGPGFFGLLPNDRWLDDVETARNLVSGQVDFPPNFQWVGRLNYIFPLNNIVTWGMGIALGAAAWLSWVWAGWRILRGQPRATRNLLLFGWVLVYFGWLGGNWVSTMRYFLPLYPSLVILAAWGLSEVARRAWRAQASVPRRLLAAGAVAGVTLFTLLWAAMFTSIYRTQATFVQASYWVWEQIPGDFVLQLEDAPDGAPLINVAMTNNQLGRDHPIGTWLFDQATRYPENRVVSAAFTSPVSGVVTSIHAPRLGDPLDDFDPETLTFLITAEDSDTPLTTALLIADLARGDHPIGQPYDIPLDAPFEIEAGRRYLMHVTATNGPVIGSGAVLAFESTWEEVMPAKVCTLPAGMTLADNPRPGMFSAYTCNGRSPWDGLINGYSLETHWEDELIKRDRITQILNETDYILIPTNRRYDTHSRNPVRWPMINAFYRALFAGELGFELVATFEQTFELGPLRVSDQYLPTYSAPTWLNEFEAEEAFHVYDHPAVFIFRKSDEFTPQLVLDVLHTIPLNRPDVACLVPACTDTGLVNVVPLASLTVDVSPTQLQMTEPMRATQSTGGTWSERFNTSSLINRSPVVAVVVWWFVMTLIGFVTWPLLFALLPGLADRGYGLAKFTGMFLSGWAAWYIASMRVPAWSRMGLIAVLAGLGVLSLVCAWAQRDKLSAYLQKRWSLLLTIEGLALALFLFMLGVRLMNPDLWHTGYGGEKPMDFAYFNGILRSTIFPPVDPWYAGGYLNYYYFGFVIVGVPTLLTGIVPSVAYNLILPTLFALAGIGAFSVAFNIVSGWRTSDDAAGDELEPADITPNDGQFVVTPSAPRRQRTLGNPWVAGIVALLMTVVLGNLDTPRVFVNGVARLGGYEIPQGLQHYLVGQYTERYGIAPNDTAMFEIAEQVRANRFSDQVEYEFHKITSLVGGFFDGMLRIINGEPLYISPDRWFWAPTRTISEIPTVGGYAINEMPYFTFLYGDLHAHMIAMPLLLLVMGFVFNEVILARRDGRRVLAQFGALALGAVAVGMSKATNSWDWPTLLLLTVPGLGYAWWLTWKRLGRRPLLDLVIRVGGFLVLMVLAVLPYDYWFATAFSSFNTWEGGKTPIWAYLTIHGLFLFFIFSLLCWETWRWLNSVRASALRGKAGLILACLFAFAVMWIVSMMFFFRGERATLIVVPLVVWTAVLFFRPGQARAMQYVLVLTGLSLCITLGVEFIVLGGDIGRQNTVFKFYMQVWIFLSVAAGAAASWLATHSERWRLGLRMVWYGLAAILIMAAGLFPIMATRGKVVFRIAPNMPLTLDGMDFMRYGSYWELNTPEAFSMVHDYNAIRWLQENARGTPVIMEGQSVREYLWGGRISIYTGLPSVVGWLHHQTQQRSLDPMPRLVRQRGANVNAFYTTPEINVAVDMLRHYNVTYVIVSSLELGRYGDSGGLAKFDVMVNQGLLSVAYQEGDATIYEVNRDALRIMPVALVFGEGE